MEINIRKSYISDAETIAKINVSSWQQTYKDIFPKYFLDSLSSEESFKNIILNIEKNIKNHNNYLIAELHNEVVGFCKIGKSRKENYENYGEIIALYVKNEALKKVSDKEICGGPHAQSTGELKNFKIIKEQSSSAKVRRIKAIIDYK